MGEITSSEEYPSNVNTIWGLRKTDLSNADKDLINSFIAIRIKKYEKRVNTLLVIIADDDLSFGLSRMYQSFSKINTLPQEIKVFKKSKTHENG